MALLPGHKANFETLRRAASAGDLALLECQSIPGGEPVPVVCAANRLSGGDVEFLPLATLFGDNPYERVVPPGIENPFQPHSENPHDG